MFRLQPDPLCLKNLKASKLHRTRSGQNHSFEFCEIPGSVYRNLNQGLENTHSVKLAFWKSILMAKVGTRGISSEVALTKQQAKAEWWTGGHMEVELPTRLFNTMMSCWTSLSSFLSRVTEHLSVIIWFFAFITIICDGDDNSSQLIAVLWRVDEKIHTVSTLPGT